MAVLWYFIILQAITICFSYDVEIEGIMRLGDEFLKKLKDDLYESRKVQTTSPRPLINRPIRPIEFSTDYRKNKARSPGQEKGNDFFVEYVVTTLKRIKESASNRLLSLQIIIDEDLNLKKVISQRIGDANAAFSDTLDKYVYTAIKQVGGTVLDTQFVLLDLIETSNKLLYSTQKRIFNEIVDENNDKILKKDIIRATEKIFKLSILDKRRQFEFLCLDHSICRSFPGFTDYFADLISEILRLSDHKFHKVSTIIRQVFNNNTKFMKEIVHRQTLKKIYYHLGKLSTDAGILRDIVSILRAVIVQRHKLINNLDDEMRNKTAAIKILLDIVDKAFEKEGEHAIAMNIEVLVQALRHWKSKSNEVSDIITGFFKYFFSVLRLNLVENTKKEVKMLIEIIFSGTSNIKSASKYLLTTGSRFVNGEHRKIHYNLNNNKDYVY